jgi:hypothetical protein
MTLDGRRLPPAPRPASLTLATDIYVHRPEVGVDAGESLRRSMMGLTESVHLRAGTRFEDLPEWVKTAKPVDANGDEVDEPLLGDHFWVDELPAPPPAPVDPYPYLSGDFRPAGGLFREGVT